LENLFKTIIASVSSAAQLRDIFLVTLILFWGDSRAVEGGHVANILLLARFISLLASSALAHGYTCPLSSF
jgi:hypothetical protein